jgi:hypothetical protein
MLETSMHKFSLAVELLIWMHVRGRVLAVCWTSHESFAEYANAVKIAEEPAFAWWVPHIIKKKARILIEKVRSIYWKTTHKFGIHYPLSVEEALQID